MAELDARDDLRKMRDTVVEQIMRQPLEQLQFCAYELEALRVALDQCWRGLLREALDWAVSRYRETADYSRGGPMREHTSKPPPTGVDVLARVRQNAWCLKVTVPPALRAELIDEVLPRLVEARLSRPSVSLGPVDATSTVQSMELAMRAPPLSQPATSPPNRRTHRPK